MRSTALACLLLGMTFAVSCAHATVWYVDADNYATRERDGTSWATAFTAIQPAIDAAFEAGDEEVWVAEGSYGETRTSVMHDPPVDTGSVVMKEGVSLYGGFAGDEAVRDQRDVAVHITIIDGSTSRAGEAAYHVIVGADAAALDGFTVRGGRADRYADQAAHMAAAADGGGMYIAEVSPRVANCRFMDNEALDDGGAIYVFLASPAIEDCDFSANRSGAALFIMASPAVIRRCTFRGNAGRGMFAVNSPVRVTDCAFVDNSGGGLTLDTSLYDEDPYPQTSPIVERCFFGRNHATHGGGLYLHHQGSGSESGPNAVVLNCVFWRNTALITGGGIVNWNTEPTIVNCTFVENEAVHGRSWSGEPPDFGGGLFSVNRQQPTVVNSIFWENSPDQIATTTEDELGTASYSIVDGGFPGTSNLDLDPLFADVDTADFRLLSGSPAIDSGQPEAAPAEDFLGIPRPQFQAFDMGAYESPEAGLDSDGDSIPDTVETQGDADDDGIPNDEDLDSDGNGVPDVDEGIGDLDGDRIPSFRDHDNDGDGIPDVLESLDDSDGDGVADFNDRDADNDGILDRAEGTVDSDDDGTPDYLDEDSDDDGVPDSIETGEDLDRDGLANHVDEDSDGNGVADAVDGTGDEDGDGLPDFRDLDDDDDGIPDVSIVVFVNKANGSAVQDGTSWETAYTTLQEAIDSAPVSEYDVWYTEIWVAEAVYDETRVSPLHETPVDTGSLLMREDVHLFGGFAGNESEREQRDWEVRATVIDGSVARGGMPAYHVVVGSTGFTLDGFIITGGVADGTAMAGSGGGFYLVLGGYYYSSTISSWIENCVFSGNAAADRGGAAYVDSSLVRFESCVFENNSAAVAGGAVAASGRPEFLTCSFIGNTTDGDGGGLHASGPLPIQDCVFTGNSARNGGGAYVVPRTDVANAPTQFINESTFASNTASQDGGGLFLRNNFSMIPEDANYAPVACTFTRNQALRGGGLFSETETGASLLALSRCSFIDNEATQGGGLFNEGIPTQDWDAPARGQSAVNCVFDGNSAVEHGGAIYNLNTKQRVTFCTFSRNAAGIDGGAICSGPDSTLTLLNSILWGDTPTEIHNKDATASSEVTYSDVQGGHVGEGNIELAPMFLDASGGDLNLDFDSPAIDAAIDPEYGGYLFREDFLGSVRPVGGGLDMGAFEVVQEDVFAVMAIDPGQGPGEGGNTVTVSVLFDPIAAAREAGYVITFGGIEAPILNTTTSQPPIVFAFEVLVPRGGGSRYTYVDVRIARVDDPAIFSALQSGYSYRPLQEPWPEGEAEGEGEGEGVSEGEGEGEGEGGGVGEGEGEDEGEGTGEGEGEGTGTDGPTGCAAPPHAQPHALPGDLLLLALLGAGLGAAGRRRRRRKA